MEFKIKKKLKFRVYEFIKIKNIHCVIKFKIIHSLIFKI